MNHLEEIRKEAEACRLPKRPVDVLIVDDDEKNLKYAAKLVKFGHAVVCRSVASAKKWLKDHSFAVLVTDIRMPGEDGHELIKYARKEHPRLPIVAMSAYDDRDPDADAFIAKPWDPDRMRSLIKRYQVGGPRGR